MSLTVRKLAPGDDRSGFRSGDIELDRFFQRFAGQNQFKHQIGTTYVAVEAGVVLGFVTVSASQIECKKLPVSRLRKLPRYPLPVLRLARLAVDESRQGSGLGLALLKAVFGLAHQMADGFGCVGVLVDAKPKAVPFYRRYGFFVIDELLSGGLGDRPQPATMFLELGAIPRPDPSTADESTE